MEENILIRFVQALATGSIRVVDLSQPWTPARHYCAAAGVWQELAVPVRRDFPL
jgi:hypothetical protein